MSFWLGGSGDGDSPVLKFTRAGAFLKQFGRAGARRGPDSAGNIATDSRGNIYLVETFEGKRIQKFVYKGVRSVPREQGMVWPR